MRPMRPSAPSGVLAALLFALLLSGEARADGDPAAAARAFSRAQSAELRGNYERAAELYELAHEIAPAKEALRAAARARRAAGQDAMAATNALQLGRTYSQDPTSRKLARELLRELAPKLTRVTVRCAAPCFVSTDGGAVGTDPYRKHSFFVEPGRHRIEASFEGQRSADRELVAKRGRKVSVELAPPERDEPAVPASDAEPADPPAPAGAELAAARGSRADPAPRAGDDGLSRLWFLLGSSVTIGLGAASVWSGMDVLERHEAYQQMPTQAGYEDGLRRERRTNLLLGATGAAAAGTLIIAFFTDWDGGSKQSSASKERSSPELSIAPGSGGAALTIRGGF